MTEKVLWRVDNFRSNWLCSVSFEAPEELEYLVSELDYDLVRSNFSDFAELLLYGLGDCHYWSVIINAMIRPSFVDGRDKSSSACRFMYISWIMLKSYSVR